MIYLVEKKTIQDVFNDRLQLREEAKKKQEEEMQRRIKAHAYEDKTNKKEDKHYLIYIPKVHLNLYHYVHHLLHRQRIKKKKKTHFFNLFLNYYHHKKK